MSPRLWPRSGNRPAKSLHDLAPSDAIAGLLADADEQEARLQLASGPTQFAEVMEELLAETGEHVPAPAASAPAAPVEVSAAVPGTAAAAAAAATAAAAALPAAVVVEAIPAPTRRPERFEAPSRPAPKLATNAGDLVFVFGLREDALAVAQALSSASPTIEVAVAGTIARPGSRHVGGRREALQARADGVRRGGSTLVAIGVGEAPLDAARYAGILHDVVPDQVWIAVDVTRKPEDTRVWANLVAEAGGGVDAIAAIGVAYTTTPDSSAYLGIPVGWADGR